MKFELRHRLPGSPRQTWALLFSEAYRSATAEWSQIERELIEERVEGDKRIRRVRVVSDRSLPHAIESLLGAGSLSYEIDEVYDDAQLTMEWTVIPSKLADRVRATGTYTLVPVADDEGACERQIVGEVAVSLPIVGKKIEDFVGRELEASYEKGTEFAREWLSGQLEADEPGIA